MSYCQRSGIHPEGYPDTCYRNFEQPRRGWLPRFSNHSDTDCFSNTRNLQDCALLGKPYFRWRDFASAPRREIKPPRILAALKVAKRTNECNEFTKNNSKIQNYSNQTGDAKRLFSNKFKSLSVLLSNRRRQLCRVPVVIGEYRGIRGFYMQRCRRSSIRC